MDGVFLGFDPGKVDQKRRPATPPDPGFRKTGRIKRGIPGSLFRGVLL